MAKLTRSLLEKIEATLTRLGQTPTASPGIATPAQVVLPVPDVGLHKWSWAITALIALVVTVVTSWISLNVMAGRMEERLKHLEDDLKNKADALNLENLINTHRTEIDSLRTKEAGLLASINHLESAHNGAALAVNSMLTDVKELTKQITVFDGRLHGKIGNLELMEIKERLARLETQLQMAQKK